MESKSRSTTHRMPLGRTNAIPETAAATITAKTSRSLIERFPALSEFIIRTKFSTVGALIVPVSGSVLLERQLGPARPDVTSRQTGRVPGSAPE